MSKIISITEEQAHQFNRMRRSLIKIHKYYQTPAQLRRNSEKDYGLGFEESIEMAYDNLQAEAASASRGVKEIKIPVAPIKNPGSPFS